MGRGMGAVRGRAGEGIGCGQGEVKGDAVMLK